MPKKIFPDEPASPCAEGLSGFKGLTKREHFAAMMLQGMIASGGGDGFRMAAIATKFADSLIDALSNREPDFAERLREFVGRERYRLMGIFDKTGDESMKGQAMAMDQVFSILGGGRIPLDGD